MISITQKGKHFLILRKLCLLILLPLLTACSSIHKAPATPNIYGPNSPYPAQKISPSERGTVTKVFYITDRKIVETDENDKAEDSLVNYGIRRSPSMAFGAATVAYEEKSSEDLSWETLTQISQTKENRPSIRSKITSIDEIERFPATPLIFTVTPEGLRVDKNEQALYNASTKHMQKEVSDRLIAANQSDIILYVHGFNNGFRDAVLDLNDVWHFSGRHGIPIAYTWPSGDGNLFGYFTDRESGEYTVHHLKETIRMLSEIPTVKNIHLLAHSRGTDISTTALRELVIEHRAAGKNPKQSLKIKNLMMAAPDLDYGVVTQRLIAEKFGPAFGQITIYMNEDDSALGFAQNLMRGIRFGKLTADKQTEREAQIFNNVKNVSFVNVQGVSGFLGHGYFSKHPGALSDIITLIKTGSRPGTEERPLTLIEGNFWSLDLNYLDAPEAPIL